MATFQIQACKQFYGEASLENPKLEAGMFALHPDTSLKADSQ
jgi:hypothetical protein